MGLGSNVAAQISESAVSAFGFSLGRDFYKGAKKNKEGVGFFIVIVGLIAITLGGAFFSGLWFFRNYRNLGTAIGVRLGAILMLATTVVIGIVPLMFVAVVADYPWIKGYFPAGFTLPEFIYMLEYYVRVAWDAVLSNGKTSFAGAYGSPYEEPHLIFAKWSVTFAFVGVGAFVGLCQRPARSAFFKTEVHNNAFMATAGLSERADGHLVDGSGNVYRIQSQTPSQVQLFAVGRRNKRGYISLDKQGRMLDWSGLVSAGKA